MHGNDNGEKYLIDMIGCAINDAMEKFMMSAFAPDETKNVKFTGYTEWLNDNNAMPTKLWYILNKYLTSVQLDYYLSTRKYLTAILYWY